MLHPDARRADPECDTCTRGRRRRRDFKARNTTDLYKNSPGSVRHRRTPTTRKKSSQAAGVGIGMLLDHLGHTSEDIRWLSMRCHSRALGMHTHAHAHAPLGKNNIGARTPNCPLPFEFMINIHIAWVITRFLKHVTQKLRVRRYFNFFFLCGVFWAVTKWWLKKNTNHKAHELWSTHTYLLQKKWRPESLQKAKVWMHPLEGAL